MKTTELSRAAGVSQQILCEYESGRALPRPKNVEALAKALDVLPEAILGYSAVHLERPVVTAKAALVALRKSVRAIGALGDVDVDILEAISRLGVAETRRRLGIAEPVETIRALQFSQNEDNK